MHVYLLCEWMLYITFYFQLLGGCYVHCVLINVLNHLHRCEELMLSPAVNVGS